MVMRLFDGGWAGKKWYLRCRIKDNAGLSYSCFFYTVCLTQSIQLRFEDKATEMTAVFIQVYSEYLLE